MSKFKKVEAVVFKEGEKKPEEKKGASNAKGEKAVKPPIAIKKEEKKKKEIKKETGKGRAKSSSGKGNENGEEEKKEKPVKDVHVPRANEQLKLVLIIL